MLLSQSIIEILDNESAGDTLVFIAAQEHAYATANRIARRANHNRATAVTVGADNAVAESTPYGWRKITTGEYVPTAYRNKGWSNTYYQHAECVVSLLPGTVRACAFRAIEEVRA